MKSNYIYNLGFVLHLLNWCLLFYLTLNFMNIMYCADGTLAGKAQMIFFFISNLCILLEFRYISITGTITD